MGRNVEPGGRRPAVRIGVHRALAAWGCIAMLAACQSGVQSAQHPTPTKASAVSPSAQMSPEPSATASPDLPLSTVTFSCRLPVLVHPSLISWAGGFATFPGGTYQEDPAGGLIWIGDGLVATQAEPMVSAYGDSPFYDLAMKRFIPASPAQTSPDGRTYALVTNSLGGTQATVDVVTVASGSERRLNISLQPVHVADFDGRYAYLVGQGVWRIDTTTGALNQVSLERSTILVRGGNLWVGRVNPADPSPPRASPARIELPQGGRLVDSIAQVNPNTGIETTWIYRPGEEVFLLGFDAAGHPVVAVSHGPDINAWKDTVLVLNSPGDRGTHVSDGAVLLNHVQADGGRIWFGSDRGIYLWTPGGGLQKVFASNQPVAPGGLCV
ncbi:MAG: hypothetical protein ABI334_01340 [Candidatus Dormiibacterota bacterium]